MPIADVNGVDLYGPRERASGGLRARLRLRLRSWILRCRPVAAIASALTTSAARLSERRSMRPRIAVDLDRRSARFLKHLKLRRAAVAVSRWAQHALNCALRSPRWCRHGRATPGRSDGTTAGWRPRTASRRFETGRDGRLPTSRWPTIVRRYCGARREAQRFIRSCLMTHRAHGWHIPRAGASSVRRYIDGGRPPLRVPTLLIVGSTTTRAEGPRLMARTSACTAPRADGVGHLSTARRRVFHAP